MCGWRRKCKAAQRIAEHFARDPRVVQVLYPGLAVVCGA